MSIRKGAELELEITKLAFGGNAIAYLDGLVVFLDRGIPGQRVRARITRKKSQYAEGQLLEVLSPAPGEVEPFCPHFGVCGGCRWQNLAYADQLTWKHRHVVECLERLGGVEVAQVQAPVGSPDTKWYRNKMELTFSNRRWLSSTEIASGEVIDRTFALGLHARGHFDRVFDMEACFLESETAVAIVKEAREWAKESELRPYSTKDHQGFWRFLVIREGKATGQRMVHVLTAGHRDAEKVTDELAARLRDRVGGITTMVHSISHKKAQVAVGDFSRTIFGPGYIEESLDGLRFRISAHSFFQTNTLGAQRLYEIVRQFGSFTGRETVWDLYCGTGTISLFIASLAHRVVGFEIVQDAIDDAFVNCTLNNIDNCSFRAGDLKDLIREAARTPKLYGSPDVIITDPPRAGMHPQVVQALLDVLPSHIIAVSCNPATLARDLALLLERYSVEAVQPVDLFPHTPHIECVVKLSRK
ncbi:MAG: 23S rRNA (uracil(1939)-C(5))-methyltransferase RlmD [Syntrophobacteraceae bacterium]